MYIKLFISSITSVLCVNASTENLSIFQKRDFHPTIRKPVANERNSNFRRLGTPLREITPNNSLERELEDLSHKRFHLRSCSVLTMTFVAPLLPDSRGDNSLTSHIDHEKSFRTHKLNKFEETETELLKQLAHSIIMEEILTNKICFDETLNQSEIDRAMSEYNKNQNQKNKITILLTNLREKKKNMPNEKIEQIEKDVDEKIISALTTIPKMVNTIIETKFH